MGNVAGQTIIAGRVSGEEIGSASASSDSSNFTAETAVVTVTVTLVNGCSYLIDAMFALASSVAADIVDGRIREDSASGVEMQFSRQTVDSTAQGQTFRLAAQYTATASGSKTFAITGARSSGSGNIRLEASSTRPSFIRVVYTGG